MQRLLTPTEIETLLALPECIGCELDTFSFWEDCPVHGWTEFYEEEDIAALIQTHVKSPSHS